MALKKVVPVEEVITFWARDGSIGVVELVTLQML